MEHQASRTVALVDLDAFFASVEVIEHPELKGKPVLIGGSPQGRGVVAAASYEARTFGCHSAMPMSQALRLCPQATVLPTRHHLYQNYSRRVMDLLHETTELVQQVSIDEAYLELTPVAPELEEAVGIMLRAQARVKDVVGLACSVGLASNKMVATIACEEGKPNGFMVVPAGAEASFLDGLGVQALPGIGPKSAERLRARGFQTLGQVARAPLSNVMAVLGPRGAVVQHRALGQDNSAITTGRETKSISSEGTFAEDVDQAEPLHHAIARMAAEVAESLDRHDLLARTVTLKLRFSDFTTITRSMSRARATAAKEALQETTNQLLKANWLPGQAVRLVGVGVSNLRHQQEPGQLALEDLLADPEYAPAVGINKMVSRNKPEGHGGVDAAIE